MSKGKKNGYICQACGGRIVTIDIDDGVTPFAIPCEATEGCKGMMHSAFYTIPQFFDATFEWYKPETTEGLLPAEKEHVENGGLLMRKIKEEGK